MRNLNNTASRDARLAVAISDTDTVFTISAGTGATFPNAPFTAKLTNQFNPDIFDLVDVTDLTGDTVTCVRNYGGTTAAARIAGDHFTLEVSAEDFDQDTFSVLVAASDAPDGVKRAARFVCDGVDDQVELQQAFDAIPVRPTMEPYGGNVITGTVMASEGTFILTDSVVHDTQGLTNEISLEGAGVGSTFITSIVPVSASAMLSFDGGGSVVRFTVSDIYLYFEDQVNGWGQSQQAVIDAEVGTTLRTRLRDVFIEHY